MITELLNTLIISAIFIYVSSIAFSFFGIGFEIYGIYMFWMISLVIFWIALPSSESGSAFTT